MAITFKSINEVFESTVYELAQFRLENHSVNEEKEYYALILLAYLEGDEIKLKRYSEQLSDRYPWLSQVATTRLKIRNRTITNNEIEYFLKSKKTQTKWSGEIEFIAALGLEVLEAYEVASIHYKRAALYFEKLDSPKKSLRAYQNYIACLSRLKSGDKVFVEYQILAKKARRAGEFATSGMALINLSREYQEMGANRMALKLANQSVAALQREVGSLTFYYALLHRAHVELDMGMLVESQLDYEACKIAPFLEIKSALKVLEAFYSKEVTQLETKPILFSWNERFEKFKSGRSINLKLSTKTPSMGELESALLEYISKSPRSRRDIMSYLWGPRIDSTIKVNRFKNLIVRVKKKAPGLIYNQGGRYFLSFSAKEVEFKRT